MSKNRTTDFIADLYLSQLRKAEKNPKKNQYLLSTLKKKNIFFTQAIVSDVISSSKSKWSN